jgi:hypothetical protein
MLERMRMEGLTLRRSTRIATVVSAVLRGLSICAPIAIFESPAVPAEISGPDSLIAAIPAQPLAQALTAFSHQTGLQLLYVSGVVDQRPFPPGSVPLRRSRTSSRAPDSSTNTSHRAASASSSQ